MERRRNPRQDRFLQLVEGGRQEEVQQEWNETTQCHTPFDVDGVQEVCFGEAPKP